jgi:Mg2+/citrate symporter
MVRKIICRSLCRGVSEAHEVKKNSSTKCRNALLHLRVIYGLLLQIFSSSILSQTDISCALIVNFMYVIPSSESSLFHRDHAKEAILADM